MARWKTLNQEIPSSNLEKNLLETDLPVLLDKAVYLKVVLDNNHLQVLNYEYVMLNDLKCV